MPTCNSGVGGIILSVTNLTDTAVDHVDVLIVGAGLSGIGAAWHLQERCPGKRYAILEAREASLWWRRHPRAAA